MVQVDGDHAIQGTTEPDTIPPIFSLPPEVLGKIFLIHRRGHIPRYTWIYVAHVCRAWRSIALNLPALWTYIDCSAHPSFIELMLRRSKEARLFVSSHFTHPSATVPPLYKILQDAGHRLKAVFLLCQSASEQTSIIEALPMAANTLEVFRGVFPDRVPETLLQGNLPSLNFLTLDGVISWKVLPQAPRLTTLKIKNVGVTNSLLPRPKADTFLHSLSGMPELQYLELTQFLPLEPCMPLDSSSALPSFKSLILKDDSGLISTFFSSCTVLLASRISISSNDHSFTQTAPVAAIDRYLSVLSKRWRNPTMGYRMAEGVQHLALHGWGQGEATFDISFRDASMCDLQVRFPHHNGVAVFLNSDPYDGFVAITGHFDLSPLQSVTLNGCEDLRHSVWRDIFSELPKLKNIRFDASDAHGFSTAALAQYEPPALPPFPALTSLAYSSPDVYDDSRRVIALIFVLSQRPMSHRIEELRLTNCVINRICAERIQKDSQSLGIVEEGTRIIDH